MSDKLDDLIKKLADSVKDSVEKIKALVPEKWTFGAALGMAPEVIALVKDLVIQVEKVSKEVKGVSGSDKKKAVMAIIDGMLDSKVINIPWVPNWLVKKIFGIVVDYIVKTYNNKFGKGTGDKADTDWIDEPAFSTISVR